MKAFAPLLLLVPAIASAGLITDREFEETITDVSSKGIVEIDNTAGYVEITGTNAKQVVVKGRLGRKVEGIEIESSRGRVSIRVRHNGGSRDWDSGEARLEIELPKASQLDVVTVSAEIQVEDVVGEQRLKSVSGEIETDAYDRNVIAGSVSGDVQINGSGGQMDEVRLSSVSGDVYGTKLNGDIEARSTSGDVIVRDSRISSGEFSSTSGDVEVSATFLSGARMDFESVSGDVELTIIGKHDGSYDIRTFSGDIDNCFGPKPEKRRNRNQRLRFAHGDEDYSRVDVTTMSGDIEICN
ncbi:MAG: DUF4097 family beta strand repeat-containing protein [Pseudomonadota bacterium]